ncbi:MAG TPA: hypothetical protein VN714_16980 [Trebonia sp.]|jgi:hypothetical protein|nr:hypothetical protein [Trebonia sp.]
MKLASGALGAGLIGLTACGAAPVTVMQAPAGHSVAPAARSAAKTPVTPASTKTVVRYRTVTPTSSAPPSSAAAAPSAAPTPPPPQQPPDQNVTDPWAVVSAYYGDIESGNYQQAYALIGDGSTTGQSYQQFAAGFACTGAQAVSENWDSGDQVNFNLAATNSCNGATQYFTGTDTVQNGIIVGANVTQTG